MKYSLLFAIKVYQKFLRNHLGKTCLFKETCSNYVYRKTKEEGFVKGLGCLMFRIKNCRPNYYVTSRNGVILLITNQKEVVTEQEISIDVLKRYSS